MSADTHLAATRMIVDTAFGIFGVTEQLQVAVAERADTGETVLLLAEVNEDGSASPLAELHPPKDEYRIPAE